MGASSERSVDLRSDTVTKPTPAMFERMARADWVTMGAAMIQPSESWRGLVPQSSEKKLGFSSPLAR
jgi:Beta-eliminating lyase